MCILLQPIGPQPHPVIFPVGFIIRLVVTKRYQGQRVISWRRPATQTNKDPGSDKIPDRTNYWRILGIYRGQHHILGKNYSFFCLKCCPYFKIRVTSHKDHYYYYSCCFRFSTFGTTYWCVPPCWLCSLSQGRGLRTIFIDV